MNDNFKICAGIVTFNPDIELTRKCLNSLISQVDKIFIYDNGSKNAADIVKYKEEFSNLEIIWDVKNEGIAKALNQLCFKAKESGFEWILTMDQDSICDKNMVVNLSSYIGKGKYGIIAPRVEFWNNNIMLTSTKYPEIEKYIITNCITSGSLTSIKAWEKIGGFDEWMFIDHVDDDFGARLREAGYINIRINKALLLQRAGEMKYRIKKNGKPILLPYYSPFRQYYICRNTVYYLRKHKKSPFINLRHFWGVYLYLIISKLIYEKGRWITLKTSIFGSYDGFKKKIEYIDYVNINN